MGFKVTRKVINLVFDDPGKEGLEIKAQSATIGEIITFVHLTDMVDEEARKQANALTDLMDLFATRLISWNLEEEDGRPIAATRDGLYSLETDMATSIVLSWLEGVVGVSDPLSRPSKPGERELLASLPMEVSAGASQPN